MTEAATDTRQLPLPLRVPGSRSARPGRQPQPVRSHTTVGLFAGIGGLELGLAASGHETRLFCEIDPAAQEVLRARFRLGDEPVPIHADIRAGLGSLPSGTSLLAAGFPCQDLSQAGRTAGIEGRNSGLVGHVFSLLRQQPVPWLVLENVPFMLQLDNGQAMEYVVSSLEELGYRWAYRVIDARAFGRPQRRLRVFVVASLDDDPRNVLFGDEAVELKQAFADESAAFGFYWTEGVRGLGWAVNAIPTLKGGSSIGVPSPPAVWLPSGAIVTPSIEDAERLQGFRRDWTKPAERVVRPGARWKLVGNAVSVPVARWLGGRLASPAKQPILRGGRPLHPGSPWPKAAWNVGDGRFANAISAWPKRKRMVPIHAFLSAEKSRPLSARATAGFLQRTERSSLRFDRFHPEFLSAVRAHLEQMLDAAPG